VGLYRALKSEPDLSTLEPFLIQKGAILCFPKIDASEADAGKMEFYQTHGSAPWIKASLGVLEPDLSACEDGQAAWKLVRPSDLKWIFVPGVAFSSQGQRLGRGRGYYDRYLARATRALRVSLIHDFQWREELPTESWDLPMDWIFSESRSFRSKRPF
jgi:5-formyltetrahydrofolate cyclo-ligase